MSNYTLLLLSMLLERRDRSAQLHFTDSLSIQARKRRDHRVTRRALLSPSMAPFMVMFQSMCDQAMIMITGVDHRTFIYLLEKFQPLYDRYTPYSEDGNIKLLPLRAVKRGRPRSMNAVQCLGLLLTWHRTRGSIFTLTMLFGVTASVCSLFIRFARRVIIRVLASDDNAKIKMPTVDEYQAFTEAISSKYHSLRNVYAVADGVKLYLEQSGDCIIQNMFYGWKSDNFVVNVLVFSPAGTVIACALNAPGSMHDSQVAEWGGVYSKLEEAFNRFQGRCVVDSAFCRGMYPFLVKSALDETNVEGAAEVIQIRQATAVRQAAEWGMRGFQGSFPRMKDRFVYEEHGERKLMLLCTIYLFNLRARLVGINQILSVYMPQLKVEVSLFLREAFHI